MQVVIPSFTFPRAVGLIVATGVAGSALALAGCHAEAAPRTAEPRTTTVAALKAGFADNLCGVKPLAGLTPHAPVDFMELRQLVRVEPDAPPAPGTPEYLVIDRAGAPCATAKDKPRCEAGVAALAAAPGWTAYSEVPPSWRRVLTLVYTRGDEVGVVRTLDDLVAYLSPIDTPREAAWIVADRGPSRLVCNQSNVRKTAGAFEVLTQTGQCPHETGQVLSVSPSGAISVVATAPIPPWDPHCTF